MDFAAIPPEINSALMYAGAGAGPMLAAAAAWDQLGAELYSHAVSYQSVVTGLTSGPWQGPASASMVAAAATYTTWMTATAAQCEQVAVQAKVAVSAYESAFAMTVPPPVIAANRAQLMALIATNVLGQNTPAIMATEAHYAEMWAQDAAAMYGYAGSSAAAATLPPFTPPQPNTHPAGIAGRAAVLGHSVGATAASHGRSAVSSLSAAQALQSLASPTSSGSGLSRLAMGTSATRLAGTSGKGAMGGAGNSTTAASGLGGISGLLGTGKSASGGAADLGSDAAGVGADFFGLSPDSSGAAELAVSGGLGELASSGGLGPVGGVGGWGPFGGLEGTGAAASIGQAGSIGGLSVPQSWADVATMSASSPASAIAVPGSDFGAAPAVSAAGSGMPTMFMPSVAGRGSETAIQKLGVRSTLIPHSPLAG